ncbi:hypothetical protein [Timonella sp. A28]|uniref:hypothetical protein n=1 Tax=Timonella sp. A28 TaxID=3442640 RepID=UPI003EBA61FA
MNTVLINYVSYYAAQVRGALTDLQLEVVDDLTEGLEADLIDAMNESPDVKGPEELALADLIERFGQPRDYAQELRSAAGLGDLQADPHVPGQPQTFFQKVRARQVAFVDLMNTLPWWIAVRDFFVLLRPAWWLLRGWIIFYVAVFFEKNLESVPFPDDFTHVLLLISLLVGSVLVGRFTARGSITLVKRIIALFLNLVAIVALAFIANQLYSSEYSLWHENSTSDNSDYAYWAGYDDALAQSSYVVPESQRARDTQISLAGATNLFVYDAEGSLVEDARIVTQEGKPVDAATFPIRVNRATDDIEMIVQRSDVYGRKVSNVFPAATTSIDLETDSCTPKDKIFWDDVLNGTYAESYGSKDVGRLDSVDQNSNFVYGPNPEIMYFGGESNLTNNADCIFGLKVPQNLMPERPAFAKLPALAPASETQQEETSTAGTGSDKNKESDDKTGN